MCIRYTVFLVYILHILRYIEPTACQDSRLHGNHTMKKFHQQTFELFFTLEKSLYKTDIMYKLFFVCTLVILLSDAAGMFTNVITAINMLLTYLTFFCTTHLVWYLLRRFSYLQLFLLLVGSLFCSFNHFIEKLPQDHERYY